ncbi:hypothetical protein EVA_11957 [gut metagenome]|uniref:Uncharacterized protein n=1 Tax=gut metagenome TaxID=749906 RepID=J9FZD2_9ZZZZ
MSYIDGCSFKPGHNCIAVTMSSLYFSTKSLWNFFQRSNLCRLAVSEACASVPISECKIRDFFRNHQIFRRLFFTEFS